MVGWYDRQWNWATREDLRDLESLEDEEHNVEKVFVFGEAIEEKALRRRGIVVDCLRTADETGRWRKEDILSVVFLNSISEINQPDRTTQISNRKQQELCHR